MTDPYYSGPGGIIYLGDARDVLPTLAPGSAGLLVTDPPYGVSWQSNFRHAKFERMAGDDGDSNVIEILQAAATRLRANRHVYVFGYPVAALKAPLSLGGTTELVWDKCHLGPGDLSLPWGAAHEVITFGVYVPSPAGRKRGDGNLAARLRQGSVIHVPRPNATAVTRHPTEKPVALMRQLIESSSVVGDTVLDPFAGAGSTLVAAAILGRKGIGIEINEQYAEIAATRLQAAERIAAEMELL